MRPALLFAVLALNAGCTVVSTAADVAGTAVSTGVSAAGTVVRTTGDVLSGPDHKDGDQK